MGRSRTSSILFRRGVYAARVWITDASRELIRLPECHSEGEALARVSIIDDVMKAYRAARLDHMVDNAVRQICASTAAGLPSLRQAAELICSGVAVDKSSIRKGTTLSDFGKLWTNGDLHLRWPDHVKKKKSRDDEARLRLYINPVIGDFPITSVTLEHAQMVMRRLPPELKKATRRQVAQVMYRLLRMAAFPAQLIPSSPLPQGFLPSIGKPVAKSFLYPNEERLLLRCTLVPLPYRMLYGVLNREGCRISELIGNAREEIQAATWAYFDLDAGMFRNDRNKTGDPRTWVMDPNVTEALSLWRDKFYPKAEGGSPVFFDDAGEALTENHIAKTFREHLKSAGVKRAELFETTDHRHQIRAHDMRGTFVTISLAAGRSETWVMDRTGHTTSAMLNRYRRAARTAAEANMTALHPMTECIPELRSI